MIKYVIVSQPRSGSTVITDLLKNNFLIDSKDEVFDICFSSNEIDIKTRNKNIIKYLEEIYSSSNKNIVGFKYFLGQDIRVLNYLIENDDIKIIYIERENKLSQISSLYTAIQYGEWFSIYEKSYKKIYLDDDSILVDISKAETLDFMFKKIIKDRKNVLYLKYSEFNNLKKVYTKISEFLNFPDIYKESYLKIQDNPIILERFENKEFIIQLLESENKIHLLENEFK